MTKLEDFSLEQLSIFIVAVLGALSGCLVVCFRSKCDKISTPCLTIHRNPEAITDPEIQKEVMRRDSLINVTPSAEPATENP